MRTSSGLRCLKTLLGLLLWIVARLILLACRVDKLLARKILRSAPFDGMRLVYWHTFEENDAKSRKRYVALEINHLRFGANNHDGVTAVLNILLVSNSGIKRHRCEIEIQRRRVLRFNGVPKTELYAVYWLDRKSILGGTAMIYDGQFTARSREAYSYCGRFIHVIPFVRTKRTTTGEESIVDNFRILFDVGSGIEVETANKGESSSGLRYVEQYSLIYDNAGV